MAARCFDPGSCPVPAGPLPLHPVISLEGVLRLPGVLYCHVSFSLAFSNSLIFQLIFSYLRIWWSTLLPALLQVSKCTSCLSLEGFVHP